jgi:fructose-1,6-bisphosphatase I
VSAPIALDAHVRASRGPDADGLAAIVASLAGAGKIIAHQLAQAALLGQLGATGTTNVQGESVKKLDIWANDVVVAALEETGLVGTLVSEEMDEPRYVGGGRYAVCFDPVDGSSNLDVNGIVGTIFSIRPGTDAVQPGAAQVAAGYIMYGPSTAIVLTLGEGVDAFTLDAVGGDFLRSHARLRMPARGRTFSVNEGNAARWEPGMRRYVEALREVGVPSGRPYTARYVGSLVADFHRTLLEGGIYLYPAETGKAAGKLRLQYEAAPIAFLAEQAGGRASTGREPIMQIRPTSAHQRVPLLVGSAEDVILAEAYIAGRGA